MEAHELQGKNSSELYTLWQDGEIDGDTYLVLLSRQLVSLEDRLEPLEGMRDATRAIMSEVTLRKGGKAVVDGFGTLMITAPVTTVSYDRKGMDELVIELLATGDAQLLEVAKSITFLRRESSRSGGLRINRGKER